MAWDSNSHQTESHANHFFFLATYPKNRRNTRKDDQILFRFSWIVMRIGTPNFSESTFPGSRIIDHLGSVIERYRKLECDPNPGIGTFSSKKSTIPPAALVFFFCFKELCGQHDSFSHPPAEKNPPGSEQRLRESGGALHRALAMPGVDHGRPAPPT